MFMEIDRLWRGGRNYLKWVAIFAKIGDNLPPTLKGLTRWLPWRHTNNTREIPFRNFPR